MKATSVCILTLMLSGCMASPQPGLKVWVLCYQDEVLLPNGMVGETSMLDLKCTGKEIAFRYDVNRPQDPDLFDRNKLTKFKQ